MERDINGRFIQGLHYSPHTEFKKGEHWQKPKAFWDYEYLYNQYITLEKSAQEIAEEYDCHRNNIIYWLDKLGIPKRTTSESRQVKHWGLSGEQNGMYGKTGNENPNWRGGITPERQALYSSREWSTAVKKVWKRDKATCQRCNAHRASGKDFHIHHIVSFEVELLRSEPSNLVLLCKECHNFVHSRENTEKEFINEIPTGGH